jgi:signal recognition particle GTPase
LYQKQEYVKQKVTYMKTLAIILSILFYLTSATAQTSTKPGLTDDEINQLSSNLAMKILLNDSQTTAVTNLLKTYRSDLSKVMSSSIQEAQNKLISSTNAQIVALLDSKQQMKFNVINADWWKSVQEDQNN